MARYSSIAVGRAKGSAGDITFSSAFGIKYFKQKPLQVANPNTAGQQAQRTKIRFLVSLFRLMGDYSNRAFKEVAVGMSAYNAFFSRNIKEAVTAVGATPTFHPDKFVASSGTLTGFQNPVWDNPSGRTIDLSYDDNTGSGNAAASDKVVIAWTNATATEGGYIQALETRQDGAATVIIPGSTAISALHFYAFFVQQVGNKASDSLYTTGIS